MVLIDFSTLTFYFKKLFVLFELDKFFSGYQNLNSAKDFEILQALMCYYA